MGGCIPAIGNGLVMRQLLAQSCQSIRIQVCGSVATLASAKRGISILSMSDPTKIDLDRLAEAHKRLRSMPTPFEGGCMCGAFRYRCSKPPFWSSNCHCRSCQRLTGSSFSTGFTVKTSGFEVLSGDAFKFVRTAESGDKVTITRCSIFGTWMFAERASKPELRSILASTLNDTSAFVLISNVYVSEAAPWTVFDPSLARFQKMPEAELPVNAQA